MTGFVATNAASPGIDLVTDDIIECPLHQGRFHIPTGKAKGAPVCGDLKTYPVKVENDNVFIRI